MFYPKDLVSSTESQAFFELLSLVDPEIASDLNDTNYELLSVHTLSNLSNIPNSTGIIPTYLFPYYKKELNSYAKLKNRVTEEVVEYYYNRFSASHLTSPITYIATYAGAANYSVSAAYPYRFIYEASDLNESNKIVLDTTFFKAMFLRASGIKLFEDTELTLHTANTLTVANKIVSIDVGRSVPAFPKITNSFIYLPVDTHNTFSIPLWGMLSFK